MKLRAFCLLFSTLIASAAWADGELSPGWTLDNDASNIRFQSVKKTTVVESSSFATFRGTITENGTAKIVVALDSVDTKIDLRNVRMRFLFFETFTFPEATITANVTSDMLEGLKERRRKTITMPVSLDLRGVSKTLMAEVAVTLLTDDLVSIASAAPLSISIADFELIDNLAKLEEAAGNITTIPSTAVTFDFVFGRDGGAVPEQQVAEVSTQAAPRSAALETTGDFSLEACVGRFEILSKTGNIYFRSGSARLDDASFALLETLTDVVSRCPDLTVEVAGHTDSDGSDTANQRLSEARAKTVANYLSQKGISSNRLVAKGYGEAVPVVPNTSSTNKGKNRRIEFAVLSN
jgi:OOP family OmpA-OmpF porin